MTYAATRACSTTPDRPRRRDLHGRALREPRPRTPSTALRGAAPRRSLAITSSLFGLVRPADRIPPYRLAGGVNLPGLGVVSAHWREGARPGRRERPPATAWSSTSGRAPTPRSGGPAATSPRRVATVRVLQQVGSRRMVVSHFNKATKGRLVRALLESGATPRTPAALADVIRDLGWKVELGDAGQARPAARRDRRGALARAQPKISVGRRVEEPEVRHRDVLVRTHAGSTRSPMTDAGASSIR